MRSILRLFPILFVLTFSTLQVSARVDTIHISIQDPSCFGSNDGYVTIDSLSTSAPTGPYNIRINTSPQQFPKVGDTINLNDGNYTITVFDLGDGNKPTFLSFSINEPFQLVSTTLFTEPSCFGNCDGSADVFAFDGTPPYSYKWSDPLGQTTSTATNLCAQKYYVTITDTNGCTAVDSVDITQPPQIQPNVTKVNVACFGDSTGSATISPTGGTGTYISYAWSSSSNTTTTETGLAPGTYTVTVTDSDSCFNTETFTITQPAAPLSTTLSKTDLKCFGDSSGTIVNNPTGGTSPYTYAWNDAASSKNRSNLSSGKYIVTITDDNGCTYVDSITLNQPSQILSSITTTNVLCNGDSTGSASVSASGGKPGYTYQWSNNVSGNTISNVKAGVYLVTITDSDGCTAIDTANVTEPPLLVASINFSDPLCNGDSSGFIDLTVSGGAKPYSYLWNTADTTEDIFNLRPGTFMVMVTDSNGCSTSAQVTLNDPPPIVITLDTIINAKCFGLGSGKIDISVSGGNSPYSYNWSDGDTTEDRTGLVAGAYTVTVTDSTNCTARRFFFISQPAQPITTTVNKIDVKCNGDSTGSIDLTVSGGTPPYTFSWNDSSTSEDRNNLPAGTYSVKITDSSGCADTISIIINQPAPLTASVVNKVDATCSNTTDGAVRISVSGGAFPYSYSWSNSGSGNTQTNLAPGTYLVTITDNNNCQIVDSVTINSPSPIVISIDSIRNVSCNNTNDGYISVSATGGTPGYTYAWSNSANGNTISNLTAGSYIVTVTDSSGCQKSDTISIVNPSPLLINFNITNEQCVGDNDGKITANPTGGTAPYTYSWSTTDSTQSIDSLSPGVYTVTVTDSSGCITVDTATVQPANMIFFSAGGSDVQCNGQTNGSLVAFAFGGAGGFTYTWSDAVTGSFRTNVAAGTYYVTATDANGCTRVDSVTINMPDTLKINLTVTNSSCNGANNGTATASPTGGTSPYSYNWSVPGNTSSVNNLSPGTYSVTVTDVNGCDTVETFIIQNNKVNFTFTDSITNNKCFGDCLGKIEINGLSGGNPPYTYQWSNNAGNVNAIDSLCSGNYTVTISDSSGCDSVATFVIISPNKIKTTISSKRASCMPGGDGEAFVTASGGLAPYSYAWSNAQNTDTIKNLSKGKYYVTVTDSSGCSTVDSVFIGKKSAPDFSYSDTLVNNTCFGACLGKIEIDSLSGGTPPYTFSWSNNAGNVSALDSLCAGTYTVTISDANLCDSIIVYNITEPPMITTNIITIDERCGDTTASCNGKAYIDSTSGGVPPYTYSWPTGIISGSLQDTITNVCEGNYQLTITDANGCELIKPFSIKKPNPIAVNFNKVPSECLTCDGVLDVEVSGGSAPYTYQWFDQTMNSLGVTDSIVDSLCSGIYFVEVTDSSGCTQLFSSSISDINSDTLAMSSKNVSCKGSCDGEASVNFNCTDPACTIEWFDASTGNSLGITADTAKNLCIGKYFVEVTNAGGCKSYDDITIKNPPEYIVLDTIQDVKCSSSCDGRIDLGVSGKTGPYTYIWSPAPGAGQGTANVSGLCAGTYSVNISNDAGCDTVLTYTINAPTPLSASFTSIEPDCGKTNGSITATVSGGTDGFYNFQWFDATNNLLAGETNATINNIAAGMYKLSVVDSNNCKDIFTTVLNNVNGPQVILDTLINAGCFSNNGGSIDISVSGGILPYTFNWLPNGQTTEDLSGLSAGIYTVMISDSANCIGSRAFEIKQSNELQASFTTQAASCGDCDGEANINITGGFAPYTYLWSNGSSADSAINLCAGLHTVKVTDSTGCSNTFTVKISNSGAPTSKIITTAASCASSCDGTAEIETSGGTPPYSYKWMHNNATVDSIGGLCAGTYFAQITDVKGCSEVVEIIISSPNELVVTPQINASKCDLTACDGSIFLNVSGGTPPYSYDWGSTSTLDSNYIDSLCSGMYAVRITDSKGCSVTETYTISNDTIPAIDAPSVVDESCYGSCDGSLISNITPSSSISFQWLDEQGNAIAAADSNIIDAACAGTYYLAVSEFPDACEYYYTVTINGPDSLNLTPTIVKPIACAGDCNAEVFVSTTGGTLPYTYSWSDSQQQKGIPAVGLCAGTYTVTVTDTNSCSATTSITLIDPPVLSINIDSTKGVDCSSDCDGEAAVSAAGGNPPYTFSWNGGQSGNYPKDLCFGPNIVTLTDATNCQISDTVYISAVDTVIAEIPTDTAFCEGDSIHLNGNIIGSSVTSFGWYNADSTLLTTAEDTTLYLPIGSYTYFLIATNGSCSDTSVYQFEVFETPDISLAEKMTLYKDEIKKINVDGTKSRYIYQWTPDTSLTSASIAEPFTDTRETMYYTLSVTDTSGCAFIDSIKVMYFPKVHVASGFSPNGDGVNDVWEIPILFEFPEATVNVFNRWGEEVFQSDKGYNTPWDGTFEGETLPVGTYYYIIDFKSDKFKTLTGPITIIK